MHCGKSNLRVEFWIKKERVVLLFAEQRGTQAPVLKNYVFQPGRFGEGFSDNDSKGGVVDNIRVCALPTLV